MQLYTVKFKAEVTVRCVVADSPEEAVEKARGLAELDEARHVRLAETISVELEK